MKTIPKLEIYGEGEHIHWNVQNKTPHLLYSGTEKTKAEAIEKAKGYLKGKGYTYNDATGEISPTEIG